MTDPRRGIPSVEKLLGADVFAALQDEYPRARVATALRTVLDRVREEVAVGGGPDDPSDIGSYVERTRRVLDELDRPSLRPVLNATGVVLHTNLGRAPLAPAAREAMVAVGAGYSNLEFDLAEGERGSRYDHCAGLLAELVGSEAALVVNNGAAALVLALNTVALGEPVLVSRGELVEIGGGFRIPEMLERAGARLVEVGSTNRTRLADYKNASRGGVGAVLKVHRSNFRVEGFTEEASVEELSAFTREIGVPLLHDLGSGLLIDPETLGLPPEPRPGESLAAGADLVAFSGDKLLGGPQAGLVVGRSDLVERLRRNPLCRALRVDKATLAALEATLRLYQDPDRALHEVPALAALSRSLDELDDAARRLAAALGAAGGRVEVVGVASVPGGGTYPGVAVPSRALAIGSRREGAHELARRLRLGEPPVVARVEGDRLLLDLRTVAPSEEQALLAAVTAAVRASEGEGSIDG